MRPSRNTTPISRISSSVTFPCNIKCCSTYRLSCQHLFARPLVKLLYLISSSTCFIFLIQQWNTQFHLQTNARHPPEVDRATCCHLSNLVEDICGRPNCTLPECTEPEFENVSTNSQRFSQDSKDKAFFIESSGNGALSYRQACAVESLALHNPNLTVNVLFTDADVNARLDILQKLVENYANVQLISINVGEFMAGTLLEHWYHCTNWRNGSYHVNNLSNALRLLTVYKFGGYYFDLDIISVRPVTSYRNFVAAVDPEIVNNNVIHADAEHPFIELAITDFVTNFSPNLWGNNGPDLMFRVLKKWCNAQHIESINYVSCPGFNVLPPPSFHPVHHFQMEKLFAEPTANETEDKPISWLTEDVVGVHVWNRMNKDEPIYKKAKHPYKRLVRDHCPLVFSIAPEIF